MIGLNKNTGEPISTLADHVRQSVGDILTTPVGSRVMRRSYGSVIPDLIDQPMNEKTLLRLYAATAAAVMAWEPRLKIASIKLHGLASGETTVEISGSVNGTQQVYTVNAYQRPASNTLADNQRFIRPLNGINQTTALTYSAGDSIVLDIYSTAGNTGLPGGCPVLVDNIADRVEFIATDSGVIGNNGADFFAGVLLYCQINGQSYPLADGYRALRDSTGRIMSEWVAEPDAIIVDLADDYTEWTSAAGAVYPLTPLLGAIYKYGSDNLISASETLHIAINNPL